MNASGIVEAENKQFQLMDVIWCCCILLPHSASQSCCALSLKWVVSTERDGRTSRKTCKEVQQIKFVWTANTSGDSQW